MVANTAASEPPGFACNASFDRSTLLLALAILSFGGCKQFSITPPVEWPAYGADLANTKYSPADQINAGNVQNLQITWRWSSPDNHLRESHRPFSFEGTPLMIDGVLYVATSLNQLAAVDADNGTTLWVFDPKSYETPNPSKSRGLAYWREGARARLFLATGDAYLYSVDPMTGKTDPQFGSKGRVDLTLGLRRTVNRSSYAVTSPPVVCRDVVIVGSSIPDWDVVKNAPPGDVRGFDAHTGSLLWTFHTIPQAEEYGNETWSEKSWMYTGHTNVWSVMSVDEELGTVYLPVGTPTNDYFGGERPGANLFGDSLVCLKCLTGERIWHFQLVHHGLWDYDPPAAPNLVTLDLNGRTIPAVVQVTKQGLCFVFNRVTGEPIWPIEERPVPGSRLPGEHSWPTQPFPTRPPPFERQGIDADDLIDFTPELKQAALEILDRYHYGPLYTPPSSCQ